MDYTTLTPPCGEYAGSCGIGNIKSFDNGEKNIIIRQLAQPILSIFLHLAWK
jgi:hypothetical protein